MKKLPLLMLLGLVLGLVGCSKVQTTTLLAEKWETGQHRTCLYGHKNLYCFQPGQLEGLNSQQKSQFTPYLMELKRKEALKEPFGISNEIGKCPSAFISYWCRHIGSC